MKNKYSLLLAVLFLAPHLHSQSVGSGDNLGDYLGPCISNSCSSVPLANPQGPGSNMTTDESFSAFIGGDLSVPANGGGEVEGKLAVGGNLTILKSGYTIGDSGGGSLVVGPSVTTDSWLANDFSDDNLIVGGDVGGNVSNYIRGDAIVGGSLLGTTSIGRTHSVYNFTQSNVGIENVGVDFANIINTLQLKSALYASEPATGTHESQWGSYTFTGDGVSNLQVFNIDENISGWGITFANIPNGATVLINIGGSERTWNITGYASGVYREYVLLNFYEANKISLQGEIDGAVLASNPEAYVEIKGNVHGRLLVNGNVNHNGTGNEIHNYPFAGDLPKMDEEPLPIELLYLNAISKSNHIEIVWETLSEENCDYFVIEKSKNAIDYIDLTTVEAMNNSFSSHLYRYEDHDNNSQYTYYRIRQVDIDGSFSYSDPVSVSNASNIDLKLFPNPAIDGQTNIILTEDALVSVFNSLGEIVFHIDGKANTMESIDLSNQPSGVYHLVVQSNGTTISKRLISK